MDDRKDLSRDCPLAGALANRLRAAREELTRRWLERIAARVSIGRDRVFPGEELLDHIPLLIDGIADYVEDPAEEIAADAPVVAKAMELGKAPGSTVVEEEAVKGSLRSSLTLQVMVIVPGCAPRLSKVAVEALPVIVPALVV